MIPASIGVAITDSQLADRVAVILNGFGYVTVNCEGSTCPMEAAAIVTDGPPTCACRRARTCSVTARMAAGGCNVPLVRLGSPSRPTKDEPAFATVSEEAPEEHLLIAVARAVRYQEHLVKMRALRRPVGL